MSQDKSGKARRRGRGEGGITKRPDGRWMVQVSLSRDEGGRRRRKTAYGRTQAEAVEELKRLGGRDVEGLLLTTSTPTVSSFLNDWFEMHREEWRAGTRRAYRHAIDEFLIPAFGPMRLEQLDALTVQRWLLLHKQKYGARRRIGLAHATLRSALSDAMTLKLVTYNAGSHVTVPKPAAKVVSPLDADQARAFLAATAKNRLEALFVLTLSCGLRLGEVTGVAWKDIDLDTGEIRVRQQLQLDDDGNLVLQPVKTKKSVRTLTMPTICINALRKHRARQQAERLKSGARWVQTGLVFTTFTHKRNEKCGLGLHPRNVLRSFHQLLTSAGLPRVRFHDLRHGTASLLIAQGVELVEVSLPLGHSQSAITADLYSHLQKQTARRAASHMDALLGSKG